MTTNDPKFIAIFRRPGVEEPGRRITMEIGATGTQLSLDDDVLGTWAHHAIRFSAEPELTLTIAGEPWLLETDDDEAFRAVAQTHYLPIEAPSVTTREPEPVPPTRQPDPPEHEPVLEAPKAPLPLHALIPRRSSATIAIALTTAAALLAFSIVGGNALSGGLGFLAGVSGIIGVLIWRANAAANRARVHSSVGPDIDAEARVARAVAHAFSARTVTSTIEGQAIDELTAIKGIGPQYAQMLIDVGVRSIESLANITSSQRAELESALGRHGERVGRERWVEQARRIIDDRNRSHTFR